MGLASPLTVISAGSTLAPVIRRWVTTSLRPVPAPDDLPVGTLLVVIGGEWSSLVAVAVHEPPTLAPALVLKNPIPLWQYTRALPAGPVTAETWTWLRRRFLIHNPGVDGVLGLLDDLVQGRVARSPTVLP